MGNYVRAQCAKEKTVKSELCLLSEEEAQAHVDLLKLLADSTRLRILGLLSQYGELCVWDIVNRFGVGQSNISHQLRLLRLAGLVDYRKDGAWVYYHVQREALQSAWAAMDTLMQSWIDIDPM
jgi:ArsR family transcriptional regulator